MLIPSFQIYLDYKANMLQVRKYVRCKLWWINRSKFARLEIFVFCFLLAHTQFLTVIENKSIRERTVGVSCLAETTFIEISIQ
jgi:hypothetical protein